MKQQSANAYTAQLFLQPIPAPDSLDTDSIDISCSYISTHTNHVCLLRPRGHIKTTKVQNQHHKGKEKYKTKKRNVKCGYSKALKRLSTAAYGS